MSIPRVPIYIFYILRHYASMTYAHFSWKTHCSTENGFKASVNVLGIPPHPCLEVLWLGVDARPHEVVVVVGGVHLRVDTIPGVGVAGVDSFGKF